MLVGAFEACVLLGSGTSPLAKQVQRTTGQPWTHAAFLFGTRIIESGIYGITSRCLAAYPMEFALFGIRGMTTRRATELQTWATGQLRTSLRLGRVAACARAWALHAAGLCTSALDDAAHYGMDLVLPGLVMMNYHPTRLWPGPYRADYLRSEKFLFPIGGTVANPHVVR